LVDDQLFRAFLALGGASLAAAAVFTVANRILVFASCLHDAGAVRPEE
jgi:hypothetical protein